MSYCICHQCILRLFSCCFLGDTDVFIVKMYCVRFSTSGMRRTCLLINLPYDFFGRPESLANRQKDTFKIYDTTAIPSIPKCKMLRLCANRMADSQCVRSVRNDPRGCSIFTPRIIIPHKHRHRQVISSGFHHGVWHSIRLVYNSGFVAIES